jgi:hypothetical protein
MRQHYYHHQHRLVPPKNEVHLSHVAYTSIRWKSLWRIRAILSLAGLLPEPAKFVHVDGCDKFAGERRRRVRLKIPPASFRFIDPPKMRKVGLSVAGP